MILCPLPTLDENGNATNRDAALNQPFSFRLWHRLKGRMKDKSLGPPKPAKCISAKTLTQIAAPKNSKAQKPYQSFFKHYG
jgi:hypothetical protein